MENNEVKKIAEDIAVKEIMKIFKGCETVQQAKASHWFDLLHPVAIAGANAMHPEIERLKAENEEWRLNQLHNIEQLEAMIVEQKADMLEMESLKQRIAELEKIIDAAFVAGRSKGTWEQFRKDYSLDNIQ